MAGDILKKLFRKIAIEDFKKYPIWLFRHEDPKTGDFFMVAKDKFPLKSVTNCLIGIPVRLANGTQVWARMQNIDLDKPEKTEQYMDIQFEKGGEWHGLTPYYIHDKGPENLAKFLGMDVDDVFPITYDLRPYVAGDKYPVVGTIWKTPRKRLTRQELLALLGIGR